MQSASWQARPLASLIITACALGLALVARGTQLGDLTADIVLIAGYYTAPWFGVVMIELIARRTDAVPWLTPARTARPAAIAFVLSFILLLPFTSTPIGDSLAADSSAFSWIGWISREFLGGGGGYVVGAIFGALLYLLLRRAAERAEATRGSATT